jgi:fumarylpyruvate hydrolase
MGFVIDPPPVVTLPVQNTDDVFPVRRVYCVGRNYADHAVEMGHDPDREPPFFFQKNPDNLLVGHDFPYPPASSDVHFEFELAVALKSGGADIPAGEALEHVFGYACALDMTRRDLQADAKKLERPWEVGKAFEHSAPCGAIAPASAIGHPDSGYIRFDVNSERRQDGDLNQMIWKIPETIAYLSGLFTLAAGDVILTGTPAGVGPIQRGDVLHGEIEGVGELDLKVI